MALGIISDTLMFRMTEEPQPSGRLSASNFSRSLVAAMSTSVFSRPSSRSRTKPPT